jgi:hypothetical protein
MAPRRGLSMSEIRKNAIDTAIGAIRNMRRSARCAPYPIRKLQQMAMATINAHAAIGSRFRRSARVYATCQIPQSSVAATRFWRPKRSIKRLLAQNVRHNAQGR